MRSATRVAAILVVMGCGAKEQQPVVAEDAQPIIGGEADTGDPGVVAVYAQQIGATSGFLCTGSVIAPTVVLTAAHCVSPEETGAGARFVVLTAANVNKRGGQQLAVREVHANPRWSPDALENGHDEGIVILQEPTSIAPLPFNRKPITAAMVGAPLRLVGYGLNDGVEQTGAGVKRQAMTKLHAVDGALLQVGDRKKGTCNGDSGGPAFMKLGGVETIVGTTSYGNATCTDGGFDARVDVDLDFIEPFLTAAACAPTCAGRVCGADGCGGTCGTCPGAADTCTEDGQCAASDATCATRGDEQEPNDSALQANPVCATGSRGKLASPTDQDWFSWTVPASAVYDVRLAGGPPGATLRVYKISTTARLSFIGDGPEVSRHTDGGGTYVGRVTGGTQSSATYTVTVQTTPDP
jgi:V8-like Glu-specific endopeptidase